MASAISASVGNFRFLVGVESALLLDTGEVGVVIMLSTSLLAGSI